MDLNKQNRIFNRQAVYRERIKPQWFTDAEINELDQALSLSNNKQHLLIFRLLLLSGWKFKRLKRALKWDCFNSRLGIITLSNRTIQLPTATLDLLSELREQATSEDSLIIKIDYTFFWHYFVRKAFEIGITKIGAKQLRNTFCVKHWKQYKSKKLLQSDMGLSTLRYLPKEIFQVTTTPLFQGVL